VSIIVKLGKYYYRFYMNKSLNPTILISITVYFSEQIYQALNFLSLNWTTNIPPKPKGGGREGKSWHDDNLKAECLNNKENAK